MALDIFKANFKFPDRVNILAPGPQGKLRWSELGPWVIAVNKAIQIPVDPDMWMVSDWWAIKTDWFHGADETFRGMRFFSDGLVSKRSPDTVDADYSFGLLDGRKVVRPFGTAPYAPPLDGMLRPDGGVSASAIEAAARFGAQEIVICGVDMYGDSYFDNKPSTSTECPHKGAWQWVPFINSLIEWVKGQGIEIYSLSPTALDVEVR